MSLDINNNLIALHDLNVTDAFVNTLDDYIVVYNVTIYNNLNIRTDQISLGFNWIIMNLLKIFNCDATNNMYPDIINYTNKKNKLCSIVQKIFGMYYLINYRISQYYRASPKYFLISSKVNEKEYQNKQILHYNYVLNLPGVENYDLMLFFKYIYVHCLSAQGSNSNFQLRQIINKEVLPKVSKKILDNFLDVFILCADYTITNYYFFRFDKMLKKDLLNFYYQIIKTLKVIPDDYRYIFHSIAYSEKLAIKYLDLQLGFEGVFNIDNAKLILDIFSHFYDLTMKLKKDDPNVFKYYYFLVHYIHRVITMYINFNDIIELCDDNKYFQIIVNFGSIISHHKCACCNTKPRQHNTISVEIFNKIKKMDLLYFVIFMQEEYNKRSNDPNQLVSYYLQHLIILDKTAVLELEIINKTSKIYKIFNDILNGGKIFNNSPKFITIFNVLEFYFGISNMLRYSIIHNDNSLILTILNIYEPKQEDYELYLESQELSFEIVQKFINYKILTTNDMLNNCFKCRKIKTIFNTITNDIDMSNNSIILASLIDSINEVLDHKIIENNLTNIIYYFKPSVELLKNFKVDLDALYYSCYLTNNINYYSEYLLSFNNPKYMMRNMVINKTPFPKFKKYIENNGLEPDNYTLELCFKHKCNPKTLNYLDANYVLTVFSICYLKGVNHKSNVSHISKNIQTREYMERSCLKKNEL